VLNEQTAFGIPKAVFYYLFALFDLSLKISAHVGANSFMPFRVFALGDYPKGHK
jgi:hypothetical protein